MRRAAYALAGVVLVDLGLDHLNLLPGFQALFLELLLEFEQEAESVVGVELDDSGVRSWRRTC